MKRILFGLALSTIAALPAHAQTTTTAPTAPSVTTPGTSPGTAMPVAPAARRDSTTGANSTPPAVQTDSSRQNASGAAPGANSFTESQARSRIEGAGFANVTGLHKDNEGVWRGRAMRGGSAADVSLDYQGNVAGR